MKDSSWKIAMQDVRQTSFLGEQEGGILESSQEKAKFDQESIIRMLSELPFIFNQFAMEKEKVYRIIETLKSQKDSTMEGLSLRPPEINPDRPGKTNKMVDPMYKIILDTQRILTQQISECYEHLHEISKKEQIYLTLTRCLETGLYAVEKQVITKLYVERQSYDEILELLKGVTNYQIKKYRKDGLKKIVRLMNPNV